MATLEIVDDCLAPDRFVYMNYSGEDPWDVAKKIAGMLKPFMHISTSATSNDRLNWDVTGDPIKFYSTWWAKKSFSGYSTMKMYIKVQGEVSKTDNSGKFTLQLHGDLKTNFGGPGAILKPFWVLYSYLFYDRIRRSYLESCRNFIYNFRNEIKKHFNINTTSIPEREQSMG